MLETHPARGMSWEGFIIDQMISVFQRAAPGNQCYFWRTARGEEVDLLVDTGTGLLPIEVKLHSAPGSDSAAGLRRCMQDLGLKRGWLIYPGREAYSLGEGITAVPAEQALSPPENVAGH